MASPSRDGMPTSTELQNYPADAESFGYDPEWGVYASNFIFRGDWNEDLKTLNQNYGYNPLQVTTQFSNQREGRDLGTIISSVAFRSVDGDPHTHRHSSEIDETPDLFQYTPAYYDMKTINNPNINNTPKISFAIAANFSLTILSLLICHFFLLMKENRCENSPME